MARMFPPQISLDTQSTAERRLFDAIRTGLGDDWFALHSLGLANHRTKPWAELDFVLIGPPGLFCLEVKGGRVARINGEWHFTDRRGATSVKREGPFQQVGSGTAALRNHLVARLPACRDVVVGFGVVFPDITFKEMGPDIVPGIVYDERDGRFPFVRYIERLIDHWRERLAAPGRFVTGSIAATDRAAILDELRGDFDLRPSLRMRMGLVNDELLRLTGEQFHVLDGLAETDRVIVRGGAGTGKTLLAVEDACRRAAAGARVLYCCFNKHLASSVRAAVADSPAIEVIHLHGLMADIIRTARMTEQLSHGTDDLFTARDPRVCMDAVEQLERIGVYDLLIVDEAQDLLRDSYLDVFDVLLDGGLATGVWRAFLDPNQNIYAGTEQYALERLSACGAFPYRLTVNCRNTNPIAVSVALLSAMPYEQARAVEGPEVEYHWYRDIADQRRQIARCVNRLLSDGVPAAAIVILSRRKRDGSAVADGLDGIPYPLVDFGEADRPPDARAIRFSTIAAYKGLESDAVLVIDVDDLENEDILRTLYVAASRSRSYLAVFIDKTQENTFARHAQEFGQRLTQ